MKYFLAFFFPISLAASAANASTMILNCQRYESNCSANACYHLSEALKDDKQRQIFAIQKTEAVEYHIEEDSALAILDNEVPNATLTNGKYILPYKYVMREDGIIILENKTAGGVIKERIEIDEDFGFYSHYMMHTDNSIQDVPLGEPYSAYFGWCVPKQGTVLDTGNTPAADQKAAPIPAPEPKKK